ncbi:MAG: hypothetical protein LBE13_04795 [Bacteroidales bacterium]|jgi:hypothetical protein|nr:hypothetical protein [Bacteroidales bacterium]
MLNFCTLFTFVGWNITRQAYFTNEGKRHFEDERLRFYFSIDECLKENRTIQAILFAKQFFLNEEETLRKNLCIFAN